MGNQTLTRELLGSGIEDLEGTIHANDAKCSAALITHGLLFAGVVTVTADAAKLYPDAHGALPIMALSLGGLTAAAFLVSIVALLFAVMPYRPKVLLELTEEYRPPRLFYPPSVPRRKPILKAEGDPVAKQIAAAESLDETAARLELVAESMKLAAIRDHESGFARVGYRALIVEVILVVAYLGVVATTALGAGG